jgi:hypothetical protein
MLAPEAQRADYLYIQSPEMLQRASLSYTRMLRISMDSRRSVYGGTRLIERSKNYDSSVSAARSDDVSRSRSSTSHTASARFSWPRTFPAGRAPGPGDRAAAEGSAAQPGKWQFGEDIGFVYYWWRHDTHGGGWFTRAGDMPERAGVAEAACGRDTRAGGEPRLVPHALDRDRRERGAGLAARQARSG